jgi:hypothetical protein
MFFTEKTIHFSCARPVEVNATTKNSVAIKTTKVLDLISSPPFDSRA